MMEPRDNALSQELLLEHAVWLRRLARELVRDPGAADDLVQETWLAAIRSRPDLGRSLRPWLARVMRNGATQRLRRSAGRLARESEVARPEAVPSARELVERAEQQRFLVNSVLSLPEPYRQTLLLRFYEGLAPAQIAKVLGVPAVTVRTHLHRGLQKLRVTLDHENGGDRQTWVVMLQPLAWEAALPSPVVALVAMALVVVSVAGGSWFMASRSGEPESPLPNGPRIVGSKAGPLEPVGLNLARTIPTDPMLLEAKERRLQLVDEASGSPLPDFMVRVLGEESRSDGAGWITVPTAARSLVPVDDERFAVRSFSNHQAVKTRTLQPAAVPIPAESEDSILPLKVGPTYQISLESSVVIEVADLEASLQSDVPLSRSQGEPDAPVRIGMKQPWVRFASLGRDVAGTAASWKLVVSHNSGLWRGQVPVHNVREGQAEILRLRLEALSVLEGRIDGLPSGTSARLSLKPLGDDGQPMEDGVRWAMSNGEGRYSLKFVAPGPYLMQVASSLHDAWSTRVDLFAASRLVQDVSLEPVTTAGTLAGQVRSQSGTYSGQLLIFLWGQNQRMVGVYPTTWEVSDGGESTARFSFTTVPSGPLSLDVVSLADEVTFQVETALLQGPNEQVEVMLLDGLEACDWGFHVVRDDTGNALESFEVRVRGEGGYERRFQAELKLPESEAQGPIWTWTRIAGNLQWNEFEGREVLVGLPRATRFTWNVQAEGFQGVSGDEASFAALRDGNRSSSVRMRPLASTPEKIK